jgi:apolipoprotein N-acyltransferase
MLPGFGLDLETLDTQLAYGQEDYPLFAKAVFDLSRDLDTPMLIGAASFDGLRVNEEAGRWEWDEHYNSVYLVEGTIPTQRYDKGALTPFGEVMPYISRWDWLEARLLAIGAPGMTFDLDAAPSPRRLVVTTQRPDAGGETALVVGTPICFEDAVPWLCRELVFAEGPQKRAELLINLSNDGWFSWWVPGRVQHAQIARFRAVESRVPVLRAVNTGMTVSIDSCGRVVGGIGDGRYGSGRVEGALLARPMIDDRLPIYRTVGERAGYLMLILTGVLVLARLIVGRITTQDGTGQEAEA